MKIFINIAFLICVVLCASCRSAETESPTNEECRVLVKTFFGTSHKEQLAAFENFDLEHRYVTYICGMRNIHPSALYLAEAFAKDGAVAFPFLVGKLKETKNDASFRDILQVLIEMQRIGAYSVAGDQDLISFMNARASKMPEKFWRDYTLTLIGQIRAR
jgi:hypothetical protein